MNERLKQMRKHFKITQKELAEKIGISKRSIEMYESGDRDIPSMTAKEISRVFGISYEWLAFGDGEMFAENDDNVAQAIVDAIMPDATDFAKDVLVRFSKMDKEHWKMAQELIEYLKGL